MDKKKQESGFSWILSQAVSEKKHYYISVIMAVLCVLCQIGTYLVMAGVITRLIEGNRFFNEYVTLILLMLLLWSGRVLFHAISTTISHKATFRVLGEIRRKCLSKLAALPLGAVQARPSGELKNIIVERIDSIETTLAHIVPEFTSNLLAPILLFICLLATDWRMALISLITFPIGMCCYMGMMIGHEENYRRVLNATHNLNDVAVEYISGIEVIKVFGKEKSSYERFTAAAEEGAASYVNWMKKSNIFFSLAMSITPATLVTVLPIGGLLVMHGSLEVTTFIYCIILSLALISPIITCMSYTDDISVLNAITDEIRSILDEAEQQRPKAMKQKPADNTVRLEGVRFAYKEKEVLHGIELEIPDGSFTALVGRSGSGKSTIARLIASLWDVSCGSITVGGVDIRSLPTEEHADLIAYVSQDNFLFNLSILENIRLGRSGATDEEVVAAAKASGCHEFILSLENGYQTIAGSSGGHLSGGERQRIAIARAMLKNAPIVILDEATAYTDPESEAVIQESVSRLVSGKTLIVIAHRLSTIKAADQIVVIDKGSIAEKGTHEELLAKAGLYSKLWQSHISSRDKEEER